MTVIGSATLELLGDSAQFSAEMEGAAKRFRKIGDQMTDIGAKMSTRITAPLLAAGGASLKFAVDFNKGLANVASLMPGATDRVRALGDEVQDMAVRTGKSTGDLTDGLYQVVSAFGDSADTAKILEINARSAAAGLAATNDAIGLTSSVTKAYGDTSAAAVQQTSDLAQLTVRLGQTTFPELAQSIGRVTPLTAGLGVAQEELFATMATFTGVTGQATEVSTQLRGVMQALMAPTESMGALFNRLGVESGEALIEQRGLQGAIEAIVSAAQSSGEPLQKFIGSIEGQTLAMAATGGQADAYTEKLVAMRSATGATDAAFNEQTEGLNEAGHSFAQLQQVVVTTAQDFGQIMLPAAMAVGGAVRGVTNVLKEMSPQMQTATVVVAGLAAAAGPVVWQVGQMVKVGSAMIAVGSKLIPVVAGISAPMLAAAAAVAAVVAVGVVVVKNWNVISFEGARLAKAVSDAFSTFKGAALGTLTTVAQKFEWFTGPLVELGSSVSALTAEVARFFGLMGDRIRMVVSNAAAAVVDRLVTFLTPLGKWAWDSVLNPTIRRFRDLGSTVASTVGAMGSTVWEIVKTMAARITNVIASMWSGVVGKVSDGVDRVTGLFQKMSDILVGNSIVPDMADMVGTEFVRLADGMIASSETGVGGVEGEFGRLPGVMTDVASREIGATLGQFVDFGTALPGEITGLIDTVQSHWSAIKDIFADPISEGLSIAKKAFFELTDDIIDALPGFFDKVGDLLGKFGDFLKDIFQIAKGNEPGFFIGFGGNPFGDVQFMGPMFTPGEARMLAHEIAEHTAHLFETISEPLLEIRDLLAEALSGVGAMEVQASAGAMSASAFTAPPAAMEARAGGGGVNIERIDITAPPGTSDPEDFGRRASRSFIQTIDRDLGQRTQRDRRMSGDRSLAPGR